MPVSTRSQIAVQEQIGPYTENGARPGTDQEESQLGHPLRNPHHRLKEKMRALTLQYEQQKQASMALKKNNQSCSRAEDPRFSTHPSAELVGAPKREEEAKESWDLNSTVHVMRENNTIPKSTVNTTFVFAPPTDGEAKENFAAPPPQPGAERIVGFSCPRPVAVPTMVKPTAVTRRLSMGVEAPQSEQPRGFGNKNDQELLSGPGKEGMGSRILVFVRLRPMGKKEKEAGSRCCVRIVNRRDVYMTEFATENDYLRLKRLRGRHFTFDASFPDSTTQQEVYSTTTAELVEAVLQGRNGTVFCYGATGAGKTYTMLGTVENPGVMVLAIKDLFNKVRQRSCDGNHVVYLSYLEVYNETVRDLLSPGRPLVLREDKQGIIAAGLTQYRAYSTDEVMALLQQGNLNRTTEPTRANETSSRSHAILQVVVEYRARDASMNIVNRVGKLSLIDLAGSERALATEQRTLRSFEGANINRSLLALSSCINALVEGKKHIPYRNSKLTQLLKDSLGGACHTVMIANISPSSLSFGETQNTLHWADRAKEIKTKVSETNEDMLQVPESETDQAKLLLAVQKENRELRVQLARLQQKLLTLEAQSVAANSSPAPATSSLLSPPYSTKRDVKRKPSATFLGGNCFTPESKRKGGAEETVKGLRDTVKALEADIERMKKDHALQLKKKDDITRDASRKGNKTSQVVGGAKRTVTRASLRSKETNIGELKSPSHRFHSPAPTAKKRSFWDIATTSPSAAISTGRKTRSHVVPEPAKAPSMLLQPGFARQKPEPWRQ